jgi:hypothetical protein
VANSRAAWTQLPPDAEDRCEAPRHTFPRPPAEWRFALVHPDGTSETYSLCTTCVDLIAIDLGTTAHEGAVPRG